MDKNSAEYKKWHLEQLINFGLNGEKISETDLVKYFDTLQLDPAKKKFIELLLTSHASAN